MEIPFVSKAFVTCDGKNGCPGSSWAIGLMQGEGFCGRNMDGHIHYIKMPFLYIVHPSDTGAWFCVDGVARDNRWFHLKGARAERIVEALYKHCSADYPFIPLKNCSSLTFAHEKLLELYQTFLPSKKHLLVLAAENFIGAFYESLLSGKEETPIMRKMALLAQKIAEEPQKEYNALLLAREYYISKDHFCRCFRQYAGTSLHQFVLQKKLEMCLELLTNSFLSMKEISGLAGFPRQAEFARFIKNKTGKSPSSFRNG